jgi:predicted secreted protein
MKKDDLTQADLRNLGKISHEGLIPGRGLMVFKNEEPDASKPPKWRTFGAATNHSFNLTLDTIDASSKDTGRWHNLIPSGNLDWSFNSENLFQLADANTVVGDIVLGTPYLVLFSLIVDTDDGTPPSTGWVPDTTAGSFAYSGNAFCMSFDAQAPYQGIATYSVQFKGNGPLKKLSAEKFKQLVEVTKEIETAVAAGRPINIGK